MKNLKIGVLGCGNWGSNIIRNLFELNVLDKVYDINQVLVDKLPIPNSKKCSKVEDILNDTDMDAVVISTPPNTHKDLAIEAIKKKKHVFIEKPFCMSIKEAKKIVETATQNRKIIFVGHLLNYHNGFIDLKDRVARNQIGDITYIKANRMHFGAIRKFESVIYDLAAHDISMILGITKCLPKKISVNAMFKKSNDIADSINAILLFENDITAVINVDWMSPYKEHRFSVLGSNGSLIFDDTKDWKEKLCLNESKIDNELRIINGKSTYIDLKEEQPLKKELESFLNCIKRNIQPLTNQEEALMVQKVMSMIEDNI